jgi:hypothetical protein
VLLQAKHDITFSSSIFNDAGVSLTAQAGNDIKVNAPILMYGAVTLSANDSASGSASGAGGVTVANLGDMRSPPAQADPEGQLHHHQRRDRHRRRRR